MKNKRNYPIVTISEKSERSIRNGHVWVYGEEIINIFGEYQNGQLVDVLTKKGRFLGTGYINDNSKIRVRIISRNANDKFDAAFYERRLRYSFEYRKTVMGSDFDCCRLIFGEADSFPGLTVDRFGDIIVTQVLSLGIEKIKDIIFPLIVKVLRDMGEEVTAIFERNDVAIREKEGLEQYKAFYHLDGLRNDLDGKTIITENGIKYNVDYINGQKTGFFLDQKYNRLAVGKIAKGKNVLDCFTHTGAFALNCAKMGAKHVTAVDISKEAIELTKENAKLNELDNMSFVNANVFDLLTELYEKGGSPYDFIILDPPAFTKSSSTVKNAERGYKEINMKAMKLLSRGSYLATCSCSHFMTDELFRKMLKSAAADAGVSLRQIEARQQSPDHPILWNVSETDYLKFYIFQVV
ncbi:MAG: class I SAM-dependent rRNA methyltransferase [Faecalibacterium sp.]|nr:class I SAM-dependent rRNA methyltransferase [Ruminococcus sp.]MCM1392511.1 class I SAM-dependent rRNA methyltransferase [Ruminococcus sp.]MCM1486096.1 class I SAM-dependent rRNA methyltransferase [Faecalibacterium sp.]